MGLSGRFSRRSAIRLGLAGAGGLLLPTCDGATVRRGGEDHHTQGSADPLLRSEVPLPEPFTVPLPVPPVLPPVRSDGEADYYELTQRVGRVEILPGGQTEVWGYDGLFPGPTIESRSGRRTVVRHRNELPVPTVVHLHGGRTPPEHDGYPADLVLPASARDYSYPLEQPAATLWYHDHRMDFTGPQVYRGLVGFHLVRDDQEDALGLPTGEREIPLMIADRAFAGDGSFRYPALDPSLREVPGVEPGFMNGVRGDCILVNGAPWPVLEVTNTRYRFRLLNASNARCYRLVLDPPPRQGPSLVQIGSDLGLLAVPVGHDTIAIAPGERFDVIVDFSSYPVGTAVTLVNERGHGSTAHVMRFVVARQGNEDSTVPARLADVRPLSRSDAAVRREFAFHPEDVSAHGVTLWAINGQPFDPQRVDAQPELGSVELWKIRSVYVEHPIHIHLAPFQVLTVSGGGGSGPHNAGWKDTVSLTGDGDAELLLRFDGYRGTYVFHCHNLEHEDMAMMANFEVV